MQRRGQKSGSPSDRNKRKKKVDYKKWANKFIKSGYPLEMQKFKGFGDGSPIVCEVCGKKGEIKIEYLEDKKLTRCGECRSKGLTNENPRT